MSAAPRVNKLKAAMQGMAAPVVTAPVPVPAGVQTMAAAKAARPPSRRDKRNVSAYVNASAAKQLRILAIGKVTRIREANGKTTMETAYYLLSTPLSAQRFHDVVRYHWGIENSLHWVLDVTMNEDQSRNRKDHSPENLALLRRLALNLAKLEPSKGSMKPGSVRPSPNAIALTNPGAEGAGQRGRMVQCRTAGHRSLPGSILWQWLFLWS